MTYLTNREAAMRRCNGGKLEYCDGGEWGTSDKTQHYAAMVADTNDADIIRAAIRDLCRDNERLAVMLKSAKHDGPTPTLGWRAMQTAAVELMQSASAKCRENFTYPAKTKEQRDWQTGAIIHANAATAIRALPGPTAEQALAEAVRLLSRDALMVENIDAVADACREFKIKPELFRAAIAKIGGAA